MDIIIKKAIVEINIQALTPGAIIFLLHAKIYCPEAITTILWSYALNIFAEQFNEFKVYDNWITPTDKFTGKTIGINLKSSQTGLSNLCIGCNITRQHICMDQVVTPLKFRDLS